MVNLSFMSLILFTYQVMYKAIINKIIIDEVLFTFAVYGAKRVSR